MAKKDENKSCCIPVKMGCCNVESKENLNDREAGSASKRGYGEIKEETE